MQTIPVKASKSYNVHVGSKLLPTLGERLADLLPPPRHLLLVTDDTVAALYADTAVDALEKAGYTVTRFVFASGEASKSTATLLRLWDKMAEIGLSRTDAVIALGGGVVGDLSGFAAATYLRGIACYMVPTTLLAMVDSAVGGKTAVDLTAGKNLCGVFAQPIGVLCDTDTLKTLPPEIFADGCAEVIKYGYIGDKELLCLLETPFDRAPERVIARCVDQKRSLVERDEQDGGCRQLLNLGHTGGHAVELLSGYSISHGRAVAIGMMLAARAAAALRLCEKGLPMHVENMLKRYHLPTECPYTARDLAEAALRDKKRRGDTLTLVLPRALGESVLYPMEITALERIFALGGAL